jgi:large subunit ribosomal protein L23
MFTSFLDRFKKQPHRGARDKAPAAKPVGGAVPSATPETKPTPKPGSEDTREAYRILLHPVVSEKASRVGELRQYVFAVPLSATRLAVGRAVFALYGVRPAKVNIVRVKGKVVRFGRRTGKQKDWKKAVVTLRPGQRITVYEGV